MRYDIEKWKDTAKILDFLGIRYDFENEGSKKFPFNYKPEEIEFYTPYLTIPAKGIEEVVLNKIADSSEEKYEEIDEIIMIVNIPFVVKENSRAGNIIVNLSLGFEYGKEYKYGEITKNKAQCCYAIMKWAKKTNDFYIIDSMQFLDFMSYYVIPNQWGIGSREVIDSMAEDINNNWSKVYKE